MATKVSKLMGVSSIVLEIATGVILGPSVLGLISGEYADCTERRFTNCNLPSDFETRVQEGLPFGKGLDYIAQLDFCSYWQDYGVGNGDDTGVDSGSRDGTDVPEELVNRSETQTEFASNATTNTAKASGTGSTSTST